MRMADSTFKQEKNKKENQPIYLYTVENYDGSNNLYFAEHDEDVIFNGITYQKFPIAHNRINENSQGAISSVEITLSNVSRLIQSYLEAYDLRRKKVTIKLVWANQLADADAYIEWIYYIDSYAADEKNVTFLLSSKFDVLDIMLPLEIYSRRCRYRVFKGSACGYAGVETGCNRTLQRCRVLNNASRFGGQPSFPAKRI